MTSTALQLVLLIACVSVRFSSSQSLNTTASPANCSTEFPATDLWGHDLEQAPRVGLTADACIETCVNTTGCSALTVSSNGECYLKNSDFNQGPLFTNETMALYTVNLCPKPANASVGLLAPVMPAVNSTTSTLPATAAGCVVGYPGTDFWGHNIESDARYNVTEAQCVDLCLATRGCASFTLKDDGRCYLKDDNYHLGPTLPIKETLVSVVVEFCPRPAQQSDPIDPPDPNKPADPLPGNSAGECTIKLPGVEFGGYDLETTPRPDLSETECATLCIATEGCAAATSRKDQSCVLKSTGYAQGPMCTSDNTVATYIASLCDKPGLTKPPQNPANPAAPFNSTSFTCLTGQSAIGNESGGGASVRLGVGALLMAIFAWTAAYGL